MVTVSSNSEKKESSSAEKKKEEQPKDQGAKKPAGGDIGLGIGSDISVTVVQKKKDVEASKDSSSSGSSTSSAMPRISVKSEKELMGEDSSSSPKDVVNVHLRSAKGRKSFLRKSTESPEVVAEQPAAAAAQQRSAAGAAASPATSAAARAGGKSPPDPIVTISKVQGSGGQSAKEISVLKPPAPQQPPPQQHPAFAAADKARIAPGVPRPGPTPPASIATVAASVAAAATAMSSAGLARAPPPAHMAAGSLASILVAPRPGFPPPGGFRPGAPALRPPGHHPPGAAGPMRMPGAPHSPAFRGTHPPPQPTGPMGMPSLHPRPPTGPAASLPPLPPAAGPVSEQLHKMAGKMAEHLRGTLEDLFREMAAQGSLEAQVKALQLEMEKMQWRHQQELSEAKHNTDLILLEMRQAMEGERQKQIADLKKQAEIEKQKAVAETKKKQWCAHCGKEAIFYCCWNTSYCDYPCQVIETLLPLKFQCLKTPIFLFSCSNHTGPLTCRLVLKTKPTRTTTDPPAMPTRRRREAAAPAAPAAPPRPRCRRAPDPPARPCPTGSTLPRREVTSSPARRLWRPRRPQGTLLEASAGPCSKRPRLPPPQEVCRYIQMASSFIKALTNSFAADLSLLTSPIIGKHIISTNSLVASSYPLT